MRKGLTDRDRAIIQQIILDRWNPLRLNKKIATHFGLTINQVRHIRSKPVFQTEYKRQLAIYQQSFDEIQLADRKERVLAMQELYEKIPDIRDLPPWNVPISRVRILDTTRGIVCRESVTPQSRSSDTFVRQRYGPVRAKRSLRPFVSLASANRPTTGGGSNTVVWR